jgi:hypothetical protein
MLSLFHTIFDGKTSIVHHVTLRLMMTFTSQVGTIQLFILQCSFFKGKIGMFMIMHAQILLCPPFLMLNPSTKNHGRRCSDPSPPQGPPVSQGLLICLGLAAAADTTNFALLAAEGLASVPTDGSGDVLRYIRYLP